MSDLMMGLLILSTIVLGMTVSSCKQWPREPREFQIQIGQNQPSELFLRLLENPQDSTVRSDLRQSFIRHLGDIRDGDSVRMTLSSKYIRVVSLPSMDIEPAEE